MNPNWTTEQLQALSKTVEDLDQSKFSDPWEYVELLSRVQNLWLEKLAKDTKQDVKKLKKQIKEHEKQVLSEQPYFDEANKLAAEPREWWK